MPAHAEARTAKRVLSRQLAGLTPPDLEQAPVLFPGSEFIAEHGVGEGDRGPSYRRHMPGIVFCTEDHQKATQ